MNKGYSKWPLLLPALVFLLLIGIYTLTSTTRCDGKLIYPLDDTYIHLGLADNLGSNGTWGFREDIFASASSSPLWTVILAPSLLIWYSELMPFVINILFGLGIILLLYRIAKSRDLPPNIATVMSVLTVIFTSTVSLTLLGMEHTLHLLLFIAFIHTGARVLERNGGYWRLLVLAPLLGSARFEGLFTVIAMSMLLLWKRRWKWVLPLLFMGFLPTIILGFISYRNGWPVVPSSLLMKTGITSYNTARGIARLFINFLYQTITTPVVWPAFIVGAIPIIRNIWKRDFESYNFYLSLLFMLTFLAHMHTAGVGWLHRYEAYLYGGGIFVFFISQSYKGIQKRIRKIVVFSALTLALLIGLARAAENYKDLYLAQPNIYMQQYQTGRFLRKYYNNSTVVISDLGAPVWLSNIRVIDGAGLASKEFIENRPEQPDRYAKEMARVTDSLGASIAILYAETTPRLGWTRCGSLVIPDNEICYSDSVIFLAVKPEQESALRRNFRDFVPLLPEGIEVRY